MPFYAFSSYGQRARGDPRSLLLRLRTGRVVRVPRPPRLGKGDMSKFRKFIDSAIPTVRECAPCAKHLFSLFKKARR